MKSKSELLYAEVINNYDNINNLISQIIFIAGGTDMNMVIVKSGFTQLKAKMVS